MVSAQGLSPTASAAARTVILTGPTASGKSGWALALAQRHRDVEIINADSLLVYRGLDIGTAKPTAEELAAVPHHLIDIRDPDQPYTAGDFVREVETALSLIHQRGRRALIVGGTAFYLRALLFGLWDSPPSDPTVRTALEALTNPELYARLESQDAAAARRIGINDRYRMLRFLEIIQLTGNLPSDLRAAETREADPRFELVVIDRQDEALSARIAQRTAQMLAAGLLNEAQSLRSRWPRARALQSVGYKQSVDYLDGIKPAGRKIPEGLAGLAQEITLATRQLVKRQRTFFNGESLRAVSRKFTLEADSHGLQAFLEEFYS